MSDQIDNPRARAEAAGYRVELGGEADGELKGKYWWTLSRDGWASVEVSPEEFDTEEEAWADSIRAHQAESVEELEA